MNHDRLETITLLIGASILLLTASHSLVGCSLLGTDKTPSPAVTSTVGTSETLSPTATSTAPISTTRVPLTGAIERLALYNAGTQDSGGVIVTVLHIMFDEVEDALPESILSSGDWEDAVLAGEIILQIENTTDKVATVRTCQNGIVDVGSEQVELSNFLSWWIGMLDPADGGISPGDTKIVGFWFGSQRSDLQQISTAIYTFDAPRDVSGNTLGSDYRFEELAQEPV